MRKSSLFLLAASVALIPSAALAQRGPHGPPPGGGMHGGMQGGMHGPNMMMMRHGGPMGGHHFQRLHRGFVVPQFWWGPQFSIGNWQMYGFADPGPDGRWIRYYDDAYLIDGDGRIRDSREDLDWDRYGEQWEMADGIPAYRGGGDDRDDDDDGDGDGDGHHGGMHHGGMHHGGPPMYGPGPGYGHGGGYGYSQVYGGGYGYGMYAYPIVIETVTTSAATGYSEEVIEEYVTVRHRARHRPRCVCRRPAPRPAPPPPPRRPPPGERG